MAEGAADRAETFSEAFLREVVAGLASTPKTLPCKYFYDHEGSALFERICELEEYYPTRADLDATRRNVAAIVERVGPRCVLVELGSGSSKKTRVLLDALEDVVAYVPIDISESALEQSALSLRRDYPHLEVIPVLADYQQAVELPPTRRSAQRTFVYFPGSTIGNFHPPDAIAFLRRIRGAIRDDGAALIGADLKKDKAKLERAYDDAAGVTAAFNLNLLTRINRELGANFARDGFEHRALYDEELGRIEMHLRATRRQTVTVGGQTFAFEAGETIRTEESYKYSLDDFETLAHEAGLEVAAVWTDAEGLFSLQYLEPR